MLTKFLSVSLSCLLVAAYTPNLTEAKSFNNLQLLAARKEANVSNYMMLTPTGRKNAIGNPIYELRLYVNGQLVATYDTVSGRAYTQNKNRHKSGTEAPLPDGLYAVAKTAVPGTITEAGKLFLPIESLFKTGRSSLGIHYDPSYEKSNGEDGTSGCIGLTSQQEFDRVLNYVRTYQPQYLEVNIQ